MNYLPSPLYSWHVSTQETPTKGCHHRDVDINCPAWKPYFLWEAWDLSPSSIAEIDNPPRRKVDSIFWKVRLPWRKSDSGSSPFCRWGFIIASYSSGVFSRGGVSLLLDFLQSRKHRRSVTPRKNLTVSCIELNQSHGFAQRCVFHDLELVDRSSTQSKSAAHLSPILPSKNREFASDHR